MAKYLILIYGDEKAWADTGPEERERAEVAEDHSGVEVRPLVEHH